MTPGLGFSLPETSTMVRVPEASVQLPRLGSTGTALTATAADGASTHASASPERGYAHPFSIVSLPVSGGEGRRPYTGIASRATVRPCAQRRVASVDGLGDDARNGNPRAANPALRCTSGRYPVRMAATVDRSVSTVTVWGATGPAISRSAATPCGDRIHGVGQEPRARKDGAPTKVRSRGRSTRYNPQPDQPLSGTQRMT